MAVAIGPLYACKTLSALPALAAPERQGYLSQEDVLCEYVSETYDSRKNPPTGSKVTK